MNRALFTAIVVALSLLSASSGALTPLAADHEAALAIVFDPHTGSNEKIAAIRGLEMESRQATGSQRLQAISALVRQSHFDMEPVREAASDALDSFVGHWEAQLLIKEYVPEDFDAFISRLGRVAEDSTADLLHEQAGPRTLENERAIKSFAALVAVDVRRLAPLEERLKARLASQLERFDRIVPSLRSDTLFLLAQLGPARLGSIHLLLRALAGDDESARKIARRFVIVDEMVPENRAMISLLIAELGNPDRKVFEAAAALLPKVISENTKDMIALVIAGAAKTGDFEKIVLLKSYGIKPVAFARAIGTGLKNSPEKAIPMLTALRLSGVDAQLDELPELRWIICALLTIGDDSIGAAAAGLLTTPKSRAAADDALVAAINGGRPLSPAIVKALKLDAELFGEKLIEPLKSGDLSVRRAALQTLGVLGLKGDAAHVALLPLLRDHDREVRRMAAGLLNTPQALARAQFADFLNDVRSDTLATRHLAARQIDDLNIEPKEITAALVRAVETGDFAARQGLTSALEAANSSSQNPLDVLKRTAATDNPSGTARAYARAALREMDATKARDEVKP